MTLAFAQEHKEEISNKPCLNQRDNSEIKHAQQGFYYDVMNGLQSPKKSLEAKYFYDETGSRYFDEICQLEEYYPYKTELRLLPKVAHDLNQILKQRVHVVEFGAGSVHKIRPLMDGVSAIESFLAIDICGEHLEACCMQLQSEFPNIKISALEGDFNEPLTLPESNQAYMGFFPGSTIGNLTPDQAQAFLRSAKTTLGSKAWFLIGVDTKKSPETLHQAYNDDKGITAKFNLNILQRINHEFNADIDLDKFEHYAYYNTGEGRIEMHLVSKEKQSFELEGETISFKVGESIHTENSYKYHPDEFKALAAKSGWHCTHSWLAEKNMFSMFLLRAGLE